MGTFVFACSLFYLRKKNSISHCSERYRWLWTMCLVSRQVASEMKVIVNARSFHIGRSQMTCFITNPPTSLSAIMHLPFDQEWWDSHFVDQNALVPNICSVPIPKISFSILFWILKLVKIRFATTCSNVAPNEQREKREISQAQRLG